MKRTFLTLRLTPEAAGTLQHQHNKTSAELQKVTRFLKEFDRQLIELIGRDAVRKLYKDTENALLLADLVKEAA